MSDLPSDNWGQLALGVGLSLYTGFGALKLFLKRPLQRAGNEHNQKMAAMLERASEQQERTAEAVAKLADKVDGVAGKVDVLLDRVPRG